MKRLLYLFLLVLLMGSIFLCLPKLKMPPYSTQLLDASGEVLSIHLASDEKWRLPIRLDEVPPLYIKMLIAYEDKRFYYHPGVDPLALLRSLGQWIKNGCIISGGSTLTMQTVRLMRPRPRTILYKIEEILQAIRLELFYTKDEILTMYLTLAPYGGNVEGLRAACFTYCQQDPGQLTPANMALMVVIPQLPTALRPHIYPKKAKQFRDKVLLRLKEKNILTPNVCEEAMSDPVPLRRFPFPRYAVHVMQDFRRKYPTQTYYKTTLIKKNQVALEILLRSEIKFFEPHQTAAAIIIENKTRNIIAYVGSADCFNEDKNGYVDMIKAIRSPGSALKPFIYALAFDENIIHPETLIEDDSTNFNGYMPTNFRDVFHGEITIREALQQSLNVPVVQLLDQLGPGRFVDWLSYNGVSLTFAAQEHVPTLPIALGGVGIRLWDLASLYCALANDGQFSLLNIDAQSKPSVSKTLLQPVASWYITRILEDAPTPNGIVDWFVTDRSPIAFKTGTSYGARDAWCFGYTPGSRGFTVGVWAGRPDGNPSPNQLGHKTAAPILHRIFNTILLTQEGFIHRLPPQGTLLVHGTQLPEALRWFRHAGVLSSKETRVSSGHRPLKNKSSFRILSPKTETTYSLQTKGPLSSSYVPVLLKLQGGKPPFFLLVNGEPVSLHNIVQGRQSGQHMALWHPTKVGFFELTMIDQDGCSDAVTVQLKE